MDYWNSLGWRDPYSAAQSTRRQHQYAAVLDASSAYTPQMVVNGRVGFVDSESGRARQANAAVGKARLAAISLTHTWIHPNNVGLHVQMKQLPADVADKVAEVWLAVTDDELADRVTAGENSAGRLVHDAVVRRLERIGQISLNAGGGYPADPILTLAPDWHHNNLHAVVFVQGTTSRHNYRDSKRGAGAGRSHPIKLKREVSK